jgi:hypothetical protein
MLKYFDLKLYRKFLILAILCCGMFMAKQNKAAAIPCCSDIFEACDNNYNSCVAMCDYAWQGNPVKHALCVGFCEDDWNECRSVLCNLNC